MENIEELGKRCGVTNDILGAENVLPTLPQFGFSRADLKSFFLNKKEKKSINSTKILSTTKIGNKSITASINFKMDYKRRTDH